VLVREDTLADVVDALRVAGHDVHAPELDQPDKS
jgi:hypothetical protein